MLEVVTHVVAAEREDCERVATDLTDLRGVNRRGSRDFGTHDGAEEHAVVPAEGLVNQRNGGRTTATEEDCRDRHACRIFPFLGNAGALLGRSGEASVRVSHFFALRSLVLRESVTGLALPVNELALSRVADAFPPHVAVFSESAVRVDRVLFSRDKSVLVGFCRSTRGNAEEAGFRVDGVETAILTKLHPSNVVTDGFDLPARDSRDEHGEVRLTASRRECASHVLDFALRVGELEDEHVFSEPAFVASENGSDTESEALLTEKSVSTVARTVGPNEAFFGELSDVLVFNVSAGPDAVVAFAFAERLTNGVEARNEFSVHVCIEDVENLLAGASHDVHVENNVFGVRDFDTVLGDRGTERAHAERNHVHGTAVHTTLIELTHRLLEFRRVDPVVGRTCIFFLHRGNEGTGFDAGHVRRERTEQVAVFLLGELRGEASLDALLHKGIVFFLGAVNDNDVVRFAHGNHFIHPSTDLRVLDIVKGKTHYELLFGLTLSFDNFERGKIYKKNPPSTTRGSPIFWSKGCKALFFTKKFNFSIKTLHFGKKLHRLGLYTQKGRKSPRK